MKHITASSHKLHGSGGGDGGGGDGLGGGGGASGQPMPVYNPLISAGGSARGENAKFFSLVFILLANELTIRITVGTGASMVGAMTGTAFR